MDSKSGKDGFQAVDEDDDRIPQDCLEKLAESSNLKALLRNRHLRQLLLEVDRTDNKAAVVDKYMREPLFVEFADACLTMVTPEEKGT